MPGILLVFILTGTLSEGVAQTGPAAVWQEGQVSSNDSKPGPVIQAVPTTPGTTYRTFSGTRFQPTGSDLTYSALGGAVHATAIPPGGLSFSLDFDLPQGATIREVVFFVVDNDATDITLQLRSYNPETNQNVVLKSTTTTGANPDLRTIIMAIDPPVTIDNTSTSYRLRVAPGVASSAHLLRGARIGYVGSSLFLPAISK